MSQGKLIVVDGADGAGKATQAKLLVERLRADGRVVETMDFPQYTQNHFGRLLRECLDGNRGEFMSIDPRIASVLYAADRFESAKKIQTWLDSGSVVVLDRYVSSNMLHQGAKIEDEEDLTEFLSWLDTMEHSVFNIPRPDLIVYLEVPLSFRQKMLFADENRTHLDTAETHFEHQAASENNAKRLVSRVNVWQTISCVDGEDLQSREFIHESVYKTVIPYLQR